MSKYRKALDYLDSTAQNFSIPAMLLSAPVAAYGFGRNAGIARGAKEVSDTHYVDMVPHKDKKATEGDGWLPNALGAAKSGLKVGVPVAALLTGGYMLGNHLGRKEVLNLRDKDKDKEASNEVHLENIDPATVIDNLRKALSTQEGTVNPNIFKGVQNILGHVHDKALDFKDLFGKSSLENTRLKSLYENSETALNNLKANPFGGMTFKEYLGHMVTAPETLVPLGVQTIAMPMIAGGLAAATGGIAGAYTKKKFKDQLGHEDDVLYNIANQKALKLYGKPVGKLSGDKFNKIISLSKGDDDYRGLNNV